MINSVIYCIRKRDEERADDLQTTLDTVGELGSGPNESRNYDIKQTAYDLTSWLIEPDNYRNKTYIIKEQLSGQFKAFPLSAVEKKQMDLYLRAFMINCELNVTAARSIKDMAQDYLTSFGRSL